MNWWGDGWGSSGDCRADEKWEQVCGWVGQLGDGERRESPRTSDGQLEDGRSGELRESAWPGRSEQGLETGTESNVEGWG